MRNLQVYTTRVIRDHLATQIAGGINNNYKLGTGVKLFQQQQQQLSKGDLEAAEEFT